MSNAATAASLSSSLKFLEISINQAVENVKGAIDGALASPDAAAVAAAMSSGSDVLGIYVNKKTIDEAAAKAWSGVGHVTARLHDHTILATQHGAEILESMKERLAAVEYDKLPDLFKEAKESIVGIDYSEEIKGWIQEHPYQTAFYVANGIVFISPGLVTTPLLGLMGFGSLGPKAASAASAYQATIGNIPKGATFALLESAAAGGYGAGIVNGVAQGGVLLESMVMAGKALLDSKTPSKEPETQIMGSEGEIMDLKSVRAKL
ncbi:hypothetical protein MMC11_000480 [Xylographa trunciseda]|nr:hypothetical protein [Xylographa trunciseda]